MLKKEFVKARGTAKVTFSLPAQAINGSKQVQLVGDWNDWAETQNQVLKAGKKESKVTIELQPGRSYQFRYHLGEGNWENDWAADGYIPSPFDGVDNSIIDLTDFSGTATKVAPKAKATTKPTKKATGKGRKAKAAATKADKPTVTKAAAKKTSTKKLETKQDDLKKIEGIGPKIEGLFNEAGITTFKQFIKTNPTKLKDILLASGPRYRLADPTTWQEQAKLADAGKWDELKVLQKELKHGKRK